MVEGDKSENKETDQETTAKITDDILDNSGNYAGCESVLHFGYSLTVTHILLRGQF